MTDSTQDKKNKESQVDRRQFLAATTGLAALTAGCSALSSQDQTPAAGKTPTGPVPTAPFDSIRDYMAALDAHGLLMKFPEIDQDQYEATGIVFRGTDMFGMYGAPAYMFDKVKIGGEWYEGPVIANTQGHWNTDSIGFGMEPEPREHYKNYQAVKDKMAEILVANGGKYPEIAPNVLERDAAPCKEVTLEGDARPDQVCVYANQSFR